MQRCCVDDSCLEHRILKLLYPAVILLQCGGRDVFGCWLCSLLALAELPPAAEAMREWHAKRRLTSTRFALSPLSSRSVCLPVHCGRIKQERQLQVLQSLFQTCVASAYCCAALATDDRFVCPASHLHVLMPIQLC